MQTEAPATGKRQATGAATRSRILEAANEQFYAQGIRATSADRIIDQVGITKVTFYRHFRSKSELVVAYLEHQADAERAWMESVRVAADPVGTLAALAADIGSASCEPGFRGCAFINAAAEFADPEDPARRAVDAHRDWMREMFADIAAEAGANDADTVARQLMILRDGAMVNGYLGESEAIARAVGLGFESILKAAAAIPNR